MKKDLIHKGRWGNADVYLYSQDHRQWVEKSFDNKHFVVRWTIGILLTQRELFLDVRVF